MTLKYIKYRLRKKMHPEEFGAKAIGEGCFRTAYRFRGYVIKAKAGWHGKKFRYPKAGFAKYDVLPAKSWFVGKWQIQPYYKPLSVVEGQRFENLTKFDYDLKADNVGILNGQIYAFDWVNER